MEAREIIELFGGVSKVANLFKIANSSVSEWKVKNRIPDDKMIILAARIEKKTQDARKPFGRKEIRPNDWHEVWPELANDHSKHAVNE